MERTHRYRREPDEVGGLVLQDRDREIIKLIYDYRFLNSDRIQTLIKGSNQVILRRLQKLFHHGYLDRLSRIRDPQDPPTKMVYGLANKGADELASKFGIDRGKIKTL